MKKKLLNAIVSVFVALFVSIGIYSLEFNVAYNEQSLTRSTKEYIHRFDEGKQFDPQFVEATSIGNQIIVVFEDNQYNGFMGGVVFQRGITGYLRPIKAQFSVGPVIGNISTSKNIGKNIVVYTAFYSTNCPSEISGLKISGNIYSDIEQQYVENSSVQYDITASPFITLCRIEGYGKTTLLDDDGNELPSDDYLTVNQNYPSPSIETAELNLINYICGLVLLGGIAIAISFLKKKKS